MALSTTNLEPEIPSIGKLSPLARLFTGDNQIRGRTTSIGSGASLKKVETLLEEIKKLPVNKFTEEMRELQVRFSFLLLLFVNAPSPRLWAVGSAFSHYPLRTPTGLCTRIPWARVTDLLPLLTRLASVTTSDEADALFYFLGPPSAYREPFVDAYERDEERRGSLSSR